MDIKKYLEREWKDPLIHQRTKISIAIAALIYVIQTIATKHIYFYVVLSLDNPLFYTDSAYWIGVYTAFVFTAISIANSAATLLSSRKISTQILDAFGAALLGASLFLIYETMFTQAIIEAQGLSALKNLHWSVYIIPILLLLVSIPLLTHRELANHLKYRDRA